MGKGGVLGACFDPIIQYVLYGAFALYVVMGIALVSMGAAYMGETGAAGSTGYSLLVIGAFMLVLGGIGIFGNIKQIWLVMLVVLLVSLGLFLFLTATIVVRPTPPHTPHRPTSASYSQRPCARRAMLRMRARRSDSIAEVPQASPARRACRSPSCSPWA